MKASPRPEIKVPGTSHNPEYNISSNRSHFGRREDGRRVAPLSQLNTYTGRRLDPGHAAKHREHSYTEGSPPAKRGSTRSSSASRTADAPLRQGHTAGSEHVSFLDHASCPRCYANDSPSSKEVPRSSVTFPGGRECSDRDSLPSQRPPRSEPSRAIGMTRGSSRQGTTQARNARTASLTHSTDQGPSFCPGCGQSSSTQDRGQSSNVSGVCKVCHRFIPAAHITALQGPSRPTEHRTKPNPITPSKYPSALLLPHCSCCGHMAGVLLNELVKNGGAVNGLKDENGKHIFGASKELQDWCLYVAHKAAHSISRASSKLSVFSMSLNASSLRRSGAVRRTGTGSTVASGAVPIREGRLIPASEFNGQRPTYTRRFSFDHAVEEPGVDRESRVQRGPSPLVTRPPFQSRDTHYTDADSFQTTSTDDTDMDYPEPIRSLLEKGTALFVEKVDQDLRSAEDVGTSAPSIVKERVVKRTFQEILDDIFTAKVQPSQTLRRRPSLNPLVSRN